MTTTADLPLGLVVPDPWCRSLAGLDDGCHFCGSDSQRRVGTYEYINLHAADCPWIEAMDLLGRAHPDDEVKAA